MLGKSLDIEKLTKEQTRLRNEKSIHIWVNSSTIEKKKKGCKWVQWFAVVKHIDSQFREHTKNIRERFDTYEEALKAAIEHANKIEI